MSHDLLDIWAATNLEDVLHTAYTQHERIGAPTLKQPARGPWQNKYLDWHKLCVEQSIRLEQKHVSALHKYSGSYHQKINACLKGDDGYCTTEVKVLIQDIRACFALLEPTSKDLTLYRGVSAHKDADAKGTKPHFLSCTWNPYLAINFSNSTLNYSWGENRILLEIQLPAGSRVCAFKGQYSDEGEYLLPTGVRWASHSERVVYGGKHITLRAALD